MKIDEKFISKIYDNKIQLKNKSDKIILSKYIDNIPMYDIYTQTINPIKKENLYYRLIDCHYRFIDNEIKNWIHQTYDKYKIKLKKVINEDMIQIKNIIERLKKMIDIIDNYDIDTLIDTSYKVLYKYSGIGLSISICKRNSFHPFILYLKPYYTKNELIKLGYNMGLLKNNIKTDDLIDTNKHFEICKFISNNDVSFDEIKDNSIDIIKQKSISDICFYSFIGAMLLNRFLRNQDEYTINRFFYNRLNNIINTIKKTKPLEKDYQIYRFISDDTFLSHLNIGDIFYDKGFTSTTRDPFYNPGMNGTFGLILVKINLKSKIKQQGIFMEHFSLFPKEEEFLLPPNTMLKLISKDDNFKYYHVNNNFEKLINKKYEFEIIDNDYMFMSNITVVDETIPTFKHNMIQANTKLDLFQKFKNLTNKYNQIIVNKLIFYVYYFDSSNAYSKFYYNKIEKGLSIIHFDENGYPLIFIELGKEMVVNYIHMYYFYNDKIVIDEKLLLGIVLELGKIFNYKKAKIFNNYKNFYQFNKNYYSNQHMFLYLNHYDDTLYNYLKNNIKPYSFEPFYENNIYDIDLILNKTNAKKELIETIEKDFNQYNTMIEKLQFQQFNYGVFNIYDKLLSSGDIDIMLDMEYSDNTSKDDVFEMIYRQPLRRNTN